MQNVAISQSASQGLSRAPNKNSDDNATFPQVVPVTIGGTVYYLNPSSILNLVGSAMPISVSLTASMRVGGPEVVPVVSIARPGSEPTAFTIKDLTQLLASSRENHLPEWQLAQYNGDLLQWHEWFGQFKSANDLGPVTDDIKLTYLKTLLTAKAKTGIAEFAYCKTMYKDALRTLERKFGQAQTVRK